MKRILLSIVASLAIVMMPLPVLAAGASSSSTGCGTASTPKTQVLNGLGETGSNCSDTGVGNAIAAGVNILSLVVGVAAVVMVILGGFKYITSGGEASKVSNAKNSLVYALVGLFIAALAQLLVHFVLVQSSQAACPPGSKDVACKPGH